MQVDLDTATIRVLTGAAPLKDRAGDRGLVALGAIRVLTGAAPLKETFHVLACRMPSTIRVLTGAAPLKGNADALAEAHAALSASSQARPH